MAISRKSSARSRDAKPTHAIKNREKAWNRVSRDEAPEQLSLVSAEPVSPDLLTHAITPSRQLWMCVYLPALALEAVSSTSEPAAVFEERKGIRCILLANEEATAAGVGSGLSVNAALALLPMLKLVERNPSREMHVLYDLAQWSERFTALTSVEAPSLLLLEIAGSQKLFGGIKLLRERIINGFAQQGFFTQVAIAPTPLAATWLARAGQKVCIRDERNLIGKLNTLPITCLGWSDSVCTSLYGMGVTSVGEAMRLPRQGFAKRFGVSRLLAFDRATGRMPDPRIAYRAPERFIANNDFDQEESDSALFLQVCEKLLEKLERFLLHRQIAVQHIEFVFFHLQESATYLPLSCVQADRAVRHWLDLLEIKLDHLLLPAPVIAIQLCSGQGEHFSAQTGGLPFNQRERQQHTISIAHLAERLAARIGEYAIHGVTTVTEHRPQYAWRYQNMFDKCSQYRDRSNSFSSSYAAELSANDRFGSSLLPRRPLWILQEPERLTTVQNVPCYQGSLELLQGPERLETGWWDDEGIARDYFVACNPKGVRLWVYRDRKGSDGRWYLHGMFG